MRAALASCSRSTSIPTIGGTGVGAGLIDAGVEALRTHGFTSAILWVHPDNARARRFYEARGWADDQVERSLEVRGVGVPVVRFSVDL